MGVSRPKRSFDREFKLQVVRQLLAGEKRLSHLCREHQLSATHRPEGTRALEGAI